MRWAQLMRSWGVPVLAMVASMRDTAHLEIDEFGMRALGAFYANATAAYVLTLKKTGHVICMG